MAINPQTLVFDNVRPASMTLDELLAGRVVMQVFGAANDVPLMLLALPCAEPPAAA